QPALPPALFNCFPPPPQIPRSRLVPTPLALPPHPLAIAPPPHHRSNPRPPFSPAPPPHLPPPIALRLPLTQVGPWPDPAPLGSHADRASPATAPPAPVGCRPQEHPRRGHKPSPISG